MSIETISLEQDILARINTLPILDVHTHLTDGKLSARGLHDILLYHMAVSELYSAGCPSGARLTQFPEWPSVKEAHARIEEAIPYLDHVQNTGISWAIRIILQDLYDWKQPITLDNYKTLDAAIRERCDDRAWQREIAARAGIRRFSTEYARRESGRDQDIFDYSLEWAFFTRCQWGEYDTALYELEKIWGRQPGSSTPIGAGSRPATDRTIHTLGDVHAAMQWYVDQIPFDKITSTATHISTDIDLIQVGDAEMEQALARRQSAGPHERSVYASYVNELFLQQFENRREKIVFQFSYAAEPLPYETGSRISMTSIAQLAEMISRHPNQKFQCFLASRHANQSLCTLARELPNLSLVGYWWHNFYPSTIRQIIDERLDMLPLNQQVGFFSDAYCIEWAYAKAVLVKAQLSRALADKITIGQYAIDDAISIAGRILYDSPRMLNGIHI